MALRYIWSAAAGSANGTTWANAYTTLAVAMNSDVAGDTLFVAHDHVEATASVSSLSAGTLTAPVKVICADRAGSVPPVSADRRTTAQISTTGNGLLQLIGCVHYDGIIFTAGNSTGAANIQLPGNNHIWARFDNCSLRIGSTGAGQIQVSSSGSHQGVLIELNNTTLSFAGLTQFVEINGVFKWRNTSSAVLGTIPTILFKPTGTGAGEIECIGVDLSALGSGKTIFGSSTSNNTMKYRLLDCKLDAAVTKSTNPQAPGSIEIDIERTGATPAHHAIYSHRSSGLLIEETTIVRSGGASDGITTISWKIVTTTSANYSSPFVCPVIAIWNDTTGSAVTATVEGIWGGGAVPLDDEIWLDVEYLGSNAPAGSFVNDGKVDLLATAANQTSSSETWGGSTTAFKLAVTFTPQQVGWIYCRIKVAKASSTFYLDPLIVLS